MLRHPKVAARSAVRHAGEGLDFFAERQLDSDEEAEDLKFDSPDEDEEDAYERSRTLNFGDYAYPNIDIRREQAKHSRWQEDDEIVHRRRRKGTISKKTEEGEASGSGAQVKSQADDAGNKAEDGPSGSKRPSRKLMRRLTVRRRVKLSAKLVMLAVAATCTNRQRAAARRTPKTAILKTRAKSLSPRQSLLGFRGIANRKSRLSSLSAQSHPLLPTLQRAKRTAQQPHLLPRNPLLKVTMPNPTLNPKQIRSQILTEQST